MSISRLGPISLPQDHPGDVAGYHRRLSVMLYQYLREIQKVLNLVVDTVNLVNVAGLTAPSTLDGTSATYNGMTLHLAAGATLTIDTGALDVLPAGVAVIVGQSGSATLAFSGAAVKENASGTSATSVTLAASGVYKLTPSPGGADKWRLTGGASI